MKSSNFTPPERNRSAIISVPGEKEIYLNCAFSDTLTIFKLYYTKFILNVLF